MRDAATSAANRLAHAERRAHEMVARQARATLRRAANRLASAEEAASRAQAFLADRRAEYDAAVAELERLGIAE